jgi:hypothetical protein
MDIKINNLALFMTVLALLNLACSPLVVFAQLAQTQDVSQNVAPALYLKVPKTLTLPSAFAGETGTTVFKQSNPSFPDDQIRVTDYRFDGGFDVFLTVSNFVNTDNPACLVDPIPADCKISYNRIGIVTLADNGIDNGNPGESIDFNVDPTKGMLNKPPGSDNVYSDLDCDWNNVPPVRFEDACDKPWDPKFKFFVTGGVEVSDPKQIIYGGELDPATKRIGQYWLALGLKVAAPGGVRYGKYKSNFTFDLSPQPFPNEKCGNLIDDDYDSYVDEAGCTP